MLWHHQTPTTRMSSAGHGGEWGAKGAVRAGCHVIGTTRVSALGFGCGRQVSRDRQAEFRSPATSVAEVTTRLRQFTSELTVALAGLSSESLDERLVPAAELWGTSPIRVISRREALIESLRHAALHLGELRLTHDLVVGADSGRQLPEDGDHSKLAW